MTAQGRKARRASGAAAPRQRCIADKEGYLHGVTAFALGKLGEHAAPAVPLLAKCIEDKGAYARRAAAFVLGKFVRRAHRASGASGAKSL